MTEKELYHIICEHPFLENLFLGEDFDKKTYTDVLPAIDRLIYNGNKTIIIWTDGDKTIVSCGESECFDHYAGFCAAVVKKVFGSTSAAKKVMNTLAKDFQYSQSNKKMNVMKG